jgi:ribonuclease BN (tRNA processing enzyme)
MSATLTVLGAGSILPRAGYGCAGYALRAKPGGPVILLDCGPGTIRNLASAGIALPEVRAVVFSHYHLDHCLDLFALAFARNNPSLEEVPEIEIFGPKGLERLVAERPGIFGKWVAMTRAEVREVELDGRGSGSLETHGLHLRCRANGHTKESVSWRVEDPGRWSLAYTGDTPDAPEVAELARDVDLFVAECSFPEEEAVPNHLTPSSAAGLARRADAGSLLLTHFYPSMDPEEAGRRAARVFDGPIELARDGSVHVLGA